MPQAQCLALSQFLIYCHSRISHDASCFHVSLFLLLFCNSKINDSSSERKTSWLILFSPVQQTNCQPDYSNQKQGRGKYLKVCFFPFGSRTPTMTHFLGFWDLLFINYWMYYSVSHLHHMITQEIRSLTQRYITKLNPDVDDRFNLRIKMFLTRL